MSTHRNGHRRASTMRALTQRQIDAWIQHLVVEVAAPSLDRDDAAGPVFGPRWIPAGELVRRMRRFLCSN